MRSVLPVYKERGKWGDKGYRGNCSGYVIKDLVEHFKPVRLFVDVCEGSGTSREVCRDLGVEYRGYDLHTGIDFTSDYIARLLPRPADICFSHPPYWKMVDYRVIGTFENPTLKVRDTSACVSLEEFLEKSRIMLLNQREATREGGVYCTLTGDMRMEGKFHSFQAKYINMMPQSELISVAIKQQYNTLSGRNIYTGSFVPIVHEYLIIWKRSKRTLVQVTVEGLQELKRQVGIAWRSLIRFILMQLGGRATLTDIYHLVEVEAAPMLKGYAKPGNWQAKVRQQLQYHFESVQRGIWALPEAA